MCAVLAVYVAGYLYGSNAITLEEATLESGLVMTGKRYRTFDQKWTCFLYAPAGRIEASALGIDVTLFYPSPDSPRLSDRCCEFEP
jgi:hypothetical protein